MEGTLRVSVDGQAAQKEGERKGVRKNRLERLQSMQRFKKTMREKK